MRQNFMGGGKLTLVGDSDKITPEALIKSIEGEENRGVHGPQRGPISLPKSRKRTFLFRGRGSSHFQCGKNLWPCPAYGRCAIYERLWREMRRLRK